MLNTPWTIASPLLLACMLSGCTGSGRFSRQDYAQLDADPFLTAESAIDTAEETAVELVAAGRDKVDKVNEAADRFAFVNQQSATEEDDVAAVANAANASESDNVESARDAEVPVAAASSPLDSFDQILAQNQPTQTSDKADDDLAAWLDEVDRQNKQVDQASAEFSDQVSQSATAARKAVQQADFSTFPGTEQEITVQPVAAFREQRSPVQNETVDDSDFVFGKPTPVAPQSEPEASWPPENFERL